MSFLVILFPFLGFLYGLRGRVMAFLDVSLRRDSLVVFPVVVVADTNVVQNVTFHVVVTLRKFNDQIACNSSFLGLHR